MGNDRKSGRAAGIRQTRHFGADPAGVPGNGNRLYPGHPFPNIGSVEIIWPAR